MIGRVKARSLTVALIVAAIALAASSAAYAGSAQETYGGAGGNVQTDVQRGANAPQATGAETAGGLPFTGLDLTLMLGGGLVLIGSGVALSRLMVRRHRV
jgi:hypothetical protein